MIKGFENRRYTYITRKKFTNVGSKEFYIIAYRDPALFTHRGFHIYLDEFSNVELILNKDYIFASTDSLYGGPTFTNETVHSTVKMINSNYWNVDLYISFYWVADYISAEMLNRFDRSLIKTRHIKLPYFKRPHFC